MSVGENREMATAKTSEEKAPSKSAFIRSLPTDMPAKEVVEKAAADGITLSESYVHEARSTAKRANNGAKKAAKPSPKKGAAKGSKTSVKKTSKKGAPRKAPKAASKKSAAKASGKRGPTKGAAMTKRAFIESQPKTMPATEVVAAAKKAGLEISSNYVYVLRAGGKKKSKNIATSAKVAAPRKASASPRSGAPETRFVELVGEIGVGRMEALLEEFKLKLKAITVG